jgi:hypothetical protein
MRCALRALFSTYTRVAAKGEPCAERKTVELKMRDNPFSGFVAPDHFGRLLEPFRAHIVVRDHADACRAGADVVGRLQREPHLRGAVHSRR